MTEEIVYKAQELMTIAGREVAGEEARHRYWKNACFGDEPPKHLWKEELYKAHFANAERGGE